MKTFFEENSVNWSATASESSDLNPIELIIIIWGSLKQYLRSIHKPRNLEELKSGVERFWLTLTPEVCRKYIDHLNKVIPKIVAIKGNPSGY